MTDDKTLATFRLESGLWEAFKAEAAKNGTNASAALIAYCRDYVSGSRQISRQSIDEVDSTNIDNLDEHIDRRVQDAVNGLLAPFAEKAEQQQQKIEQLEMALGESAA